MKLRRLEAEPERASDAKVVRRAAMDHLARREFAKVELSRRLISKGYVAEVVNEVLAVLEAESLLSDARFAESYTRSRIGRGYGPVRIRIELQDRGVDKDEMETALAAVAPDWLDVITQARAKRFGVARPADFKERARQSRFLAYRGFTSDQIRWVMAGDEQQV